MNYLKLFVIFALSAAAITACDPKDETVPVTSVEITSTPSPLTLTVGGTTGRVSARVLPADATDKTITWSVAPEGVVTVAADGTVTAVASGSATITATAANDIKSTCSVTVTEPESIVYSYTGNYTVSSEGSDDYFVWPDATITITINPEETTADMLMMQAKFAEGMPRAMDITVSGVTVAKTAEGYSISGDGIVPTTVMGGNVIEVDMFTMTDFTGTITEDEMSWEMMCGTYPLSFEGTATAE